MTESSILEKLADLLRQRNQIDHEIACLIGRPAHTGHLGEFVAAKVFNIKLADLATQKGSDGHFTSGTLAGRSVNVKKYSRDDSKHNIRPEALPDYYLVLTGPRAPAASSKGTTQPWTIKSVFLFEAASLVQALKQRCIRIGVATSVRRHYWDSAEIYPTQANPALILTPEQRSSLELFKG